MLILGLLKILKLLTLLIFLLFMYFCYCCNHYHCHCHYHYHYHHLHHYRFIIVNTITNDLLLSVLSLLISSLLPFVILLLPHFFNQAASENSMYTLTKQHVEAASL